MPSLQTINNDHTVLKHCLNVGVRRGLFTVNTASQVPLPDPHNERDRVLSDEEWTRLYEVAKPHLKPILLSCLSPGTTTWRDYSVDVGSCEPATGLYHLTGSGYQN